MPDRFWRDNVIQPALDRDVDAAVAEQQSILAKDPKNADAYFALGTLSQFRGDVETAVRHFQKSIELDSGHAAAHVSLGRIQALQGEYEQAWKHARAAEALGVNDLAEMLSRYPNLR